MKPIGTVQSLLASLLFSLLLFAAEAPSVSSQTRTWVLAVIGDYGTGDSNELAVANLVKSWNPDAVITVGDNNYPSGSASTIDLNIGQYYSDFIYPYKGAFTQTASTNKFFPSLGNHDWMTSNAGPYLDYFTLPHNERYYDFVLGTVHLFAIDSGPSEPDGITSSSAQAAWLHSQMDASSSCWNLVYFHHAPYSSGPHGADPSDPGRNMTWPFRSWGADAVIAGHDHDYERIILDGLPYLVNGAGGASLYSFGAPVPGSQVRYAGSHGAMRLTASPDLLTLEFFTVDGVSIDKYTRTGRCQIFLPAITTQ